jgi:hypothetical protein
MLQSFKDSTAKDHDGGSVDQNEYGKILKRFCAVQPRDDSEQRHKARRHRCKLKCLATSAPAQSVKKKTNAPDKTATGK